jgi:predicted DNA-binding transcriptional regulator YafY
MLYQRSMNIERRLAAVLDLIRTSGYSAPRLAEAVGVSIPTVSRDLRALRERGHDIRAEKSVDGWRYVLFSNSRQESSGSGVLARLQA